MAPGNAVLKFFLLFTLVPAFELWLLIEVGSVIGGLPTLVVCALTGAVGVALARSQGRGLLAQIQRETAEGRIPAAALVDGALIMAAGLVLMTPGLVTDAVGLLLLTPPFRWLIRRRIQVWAVANMKVTGVHTHKGYAMHASWSSGEAPRPPRDPDVQILPPARGASRTSGRERLVIDADELD